jgi:glyoxylase-like metal-dependent hydrolase (beta-lactamase superfamily II)
VPLPIQPILGRIGRCFLVEHRGVLSLVDTGGAGSERRIWRGLRRAGKGPADVRQILLTHCHGDHAGTAARLRDEMGAPVVVHAADAGVVAGRDPYPFAPSAWGHAAYGWLSRYRRFEPDHLVDGRAELDGGLEMIPAPGHTDGHAAVWAPDLRALFLGDAVWQIGPLRPSWMAFTRDWERNLDSIRSLADLPSEALFLGHGSPVRRSGRDRLRSLVRAP